MQHFFLVYKQLEHKDTAVNEVRGQMDAVAIIQQSIENYQSVFGAESAGQ